MAVEAQRKKFTVDDYYAMLKAGILTEDDHVELIKGEIVEMTPSGSNHAGCINNFVRQFKRIPDYKAIMAIQNPLRIEIDTEPEPDIILLKKVEDGYYSRHPEASDVLLLIEVSDSSYRFDRTVKLSIYAKAGIPEYWIVNLEAEELEIFRDPKSDSYETSVVINRTSGKRFSPAAFPEIELKLEDLIY